MVDSVSFPHLALIFGDAGGFRGAEETEQSERRVENPSGYFPHDKEAPNVVHRDSPAVLQ